MFSLQTLTYPLNTNILNNFGGIEANSLLTVTNIEEDENNELRIIDNSLYYTADELIIHFRSVTSNFIVLSLNIQSINSKYDQFVTFLDILNAQNIRIDAICLQETWLGANDSSSLYQLDNYHCIFKPKHCSSHAGLAIYLLETYEYKVLDLSRNSDIWESLLVEIPASKQNKHIILGNIYKPPKENNNTNIETFISELTSDLYNLDRLNTNVILAGDFNINLLQIKNRPVFANYFDLLITNGFSPSITLPTRFTDTSCTLIDNIFYKSNTNDNIISSGIILTDISDHLPCFANFNLSLFTKHKKPVIFKRPPFQKHIQQICNEITSQKLYDRLDTSLTQDPNFNYDILESTIISAMDKFIPIKRIKFNKYKHKKQPWVTNGILKSIRYKDKMYRALKQSSPNITGFLDKKHNLRVYKSILAKCIRNAKKLYYHSQLHTHKSNPAKTWNIIRDIIKTNKDNSSTSELYIQGNTVTDKKQIVFEFNKYFSEIGNKLANNLKNNTNNYEKYLLNEIPSKFTFKNVNEHDINAVFKELHPKNSAGYDGISTKLLLALQHTIVKPITLIINQSLNTGIFPSKLKVAKVIPIFKKGNKKLLENYRPISILPSLSKIFEKVVFHQLYSYFDTNNLLNPNQYGFRKKISTEHAILHIVDRLLFEIDNFKTPIAIFLDLSKAFDTLNSEILIGKLKFYGISNNALEWFHSYMTDRKQFIEFQNEKSDFTKIKTGVPQGSILGPLLFIIYINDIINATSYFESILYADDTYLINTSINLNDQNEINNLNLELSKISEWLTTNKLTLSVPKTKYCLFTTRNKSISSIKVTINNEQIQKVPEFSFLGVTLNENMSWRSHIDKISNKISRIIGLLCKRKHILPLFTLKTLYSSLILPHLNYGNLAWGSDTSHVFKLQKKAIRQITNSKFNAHTEPLFKSLELLKLDDYFQILLQICSQ